MKGRDATLDIAKGLAIIAIVAGHVLRGIGNAGLLDKESAVYLISDRAIYSLHLAVFAVAAGLVVSGAIERRGSVQYARQRLADFAWLYVVWSLLQGSLQVLMASAVNHGQDWASVLNLAEPKNHMWFFPWIAVCSLVVAWARPWTSAPRAWLWGLSSVALSVGVWGLFGPYLFLQGHGLTALFMLAAIWTLPRFQSFMAHLGTGTRLAVALGSGAVWAALMMWTPAAGPTYSKLVRTPVNVALSVVAVVCGIVAVLLLSALLAQLTRGVEWLAGLGRNSLQIFLAHVLALAGTRIVLVKLGISSPLVHLAVGTLAGVVGSLLLWQFTKTWLPWLWRAPTFLSRAGQPKG